MKNITAKERKAKIEELKKSNLVIYEYEHQKIPRGVVLRGWEAIKHNEGISLIFHPKETPKKKTRGRSAKSTQTQSTTQKKKAVAPAENKKAED